jgi:deoxyribodipyrimidine photolyase-related protein
MSNFRNTSYEVINKSVEYYKNHKIKLASFEGFIRQIIGWRTYVYSIYILDGKQMYNSNQLHNKKKLSSFNSNILIIFLISKWVILF